MRISVSFWILLLITAICHPAFAQDSLGVASPDSVQMDSLRADSLTGSDRFAGQFEERETKKAERIFPWFQSMPLNTFEVTNDSLLRWQIWPNYGDFYAYRKDVLSARQGTIARTDAFNINGYNPYEQQIYVDGIDLSNPVTGLTNFNYVPHHKIGLVTEQFNGSYKSNISLKNYYLTEPISYLNYDEASDNYRNLEFMVTQNLSERTNIELSYWDRRDGGYYPRNRVEGSQIVGRAYHYLNQNVQIRALIIRNQFEREDAFGYAVTDPTQFPFGVYSPSPNQSSAKAAIKRRDFIVGIYRRPDTLSTEDAGFEITLSKDRFNLPFSGDTVGGDISGYKSNTFKHFSLGRLSLSPGVRADYYQVKNDRNLDKRDWGKFEGYGDVSIKLTETVGLFGNGELSLRTDNKQGAELTGGFKVENSRYKATLSVSSFSRIPSIQALYWSSRNFAGNDSLSNENGISAFGAFDLKLGNYLNVGISGRYKLSENATFIGVDSSFVNGDALSVLSGTVYGRFENQRFEIESSATVHAATSEAPTSVLAANNKPDMKFWIRNDAFWKGYAFNRATFVKLGVRTLLSPFPYRSDYFNNEIQFWQSGNANQSELFSFFRLDAEVSARVRRIMVVIRWENTLEGVGQLGYFESATYPMPGRRLIVGIRAKFLN